MRRYLVIAEEGLGYERIEPGVQIVIDRFDRLEIATRILDEPRRLQCIVSTCTVVVEGSSGPCSASGSQRDFRELFQRSQRGDDRGWRRRRGRG